MQISDFSALARPLDISYRSNLSIMMMSSLTLLLAFFYQWWHLDTEFGESLWWAVQASLSVFFAWALGREIDPDVNATAFLATPFSLATFYVSGAYAWFILLAFLMLTRISSHICGRSVKVTDAILCLALVAYLCWQGHVLIGFAFAIAFLTNSRLPPAHKRSLWYGVVSLFISILTLFFRPLHTSYEDYHFAGWWITGFVAVALIFLLVIREYKYPHSTEDYKEQALNSPRIQIAQLIVLLSILIILFTQDFTATLEIFPLWAVVLSADLLRMYRWLTKHSLH